MYKFPPLKAGWYLRVVRLNLPVLVNKIEQKIPLKSGFWSYSCLTPDRYNFFAINSITQSIIMARNNTNQDLQNEENNQSPRSKRGFASMDPVRQREISSSGGRVAHEKGTAHEFNSEEARIAGRKGGEVVSRNREHMAEIGRRGGEARGANRNQNKLGNEPGTENISDNLTAEGQV